MSDRMSISGAGLTGPFLVFRGPLRPRRIFEGGGSRFIMFPALRRLWWIPLGLTVLAVASALWFDNFWIKMFSATCVPFGLLTWYALYVVALTAGHEVLVRDEDLTVICPGAPQPRKGIRRIMFAGAARIVRDFTVTRKLSRASIRGVALREGRFHEGREGRASWQGHELRVEAADGAVILVDGSDAEGLERLGRELAVALSVGFTRR